MSAELRSYYHGRWLFWLPAWPRLTLQRWLEGHGLPVGQLQQLLDENCFWARGRCAADLLRCLCGSDVVVSIWRNEQLVAIGRASSDGIYRAVLWDVVVSKDQQGKGAGRTVVERLLAAPLVHRAERIYAMTTQQQGFYERLGFRCETRQSLMLLER